MNRRSVTFVLIAGLGLLAACVGHDHTHGEDDGAPAELPTVAVTRWTDRTELFMEFPVFVAGESGRSAIHVTDLSDFSPLSAGEAIVSMRSANGEVLEFRGGPSRPGIFGVDLRADRPGIYEMTLRIDAPGLLDLHEIGQVTVYAPEAPLPGEEEEGDGISFLKEQQWTLEFGTTSAVAHGIRPSITVPGTIRPRSGGDALVTSPVPGRVAPASEVPLPGTRVRAGAVLAQIVPRSDDQRDPAGLRADLVEAEQAHALAVSQRDRAARLVEARALPARRLEEAEAESIASAARLDAARERWTRFESLQSAGGEVTAATVTVRAPFDGVVSQVRLTPGAGVEANEVLMRVVDPDRVHVIGAVPESLAATMGPVVGGELVFDGRPSMELGEPLAVSPVVDPVARTIHVSFALDNRETRLQVGKAVRLRLFVGGEESGIAVPVTAVVDDGGRPVVFVQTGGESFERRPVRLGNRANGFVRVLAGVEAGERVVHHGAYLVRLAAMSTQIPAHGHVH